MSSLRHTTILETLSTSSRLLIGSGTLFLGGALFQLPYQRLIPNSRTSLNC